MLLLGVGVLGEAVDTWVGSGADHVVDDAAELAELVDVVQSWSSSSTSP